MKKEITKFVENLGGRTAYQGKTKTMYISDPLNIRIINSIIEHFGDNLPFVLNDTSFMIG